MTRSGDPGRWNRQVIGNTGPQGTKEWPDQRARRTVESQDAHTRQGLWGVEPDPLESGVDQDSWSDRSGGLRLRNSQPAFRKESMSPPSAWNGAARDPCRQRMLLELVPGPDFRVGWVVVAWGVGSDTGPKTRRAAGVNGPPSGWSKRASVASQRWRSARCQGVADGSLVRERCRHRAPLRSISGETVPLTVTNPSGESRCRPVGGGPSQARSTGDSPCGLWGAMGCHCAFRWITPVTTAPDGVVPMCPTPSTDSTGR